MEKNNRELPVGFGMSLAMNKKAMENYSKLSYSEQNKVISYIQDNKSGFEAKKKINNAVYNLEIGDMNFIE